MTSSALRIQYPDQHAMPDQIPPKRLAIELPAHERGRSDYDLQQLDWINARLARNTYKASSDSTAAQKREADLRAREALEGSAERKQLDREVRDGIAETEAQAALRGEMVGEDKAGIRRILDRDPLAGLTWLTKEQFEAGQEMREAYLLRADDLGAVEFTGMPGSPHDNDKYVKSRLKRAKATNCVAMVETAVLNGHYRSGGGYLVRVAIWARFRAEGIEPNVSLGILRVVCERGFTLTSQGRGRAYDRNCKALAMALDVAHAVKKGD